MTDSREYPLRPICAVGVVVRKDGCVLLIQRAKPPRMGEWAIPGGAIELGETVREAARREVREECGIEIQIDGLVEDFDIIERDESGRVQFHYAIFEMAGSYAQGELSISDEVMDTRWVSLKNLSDYALRPKTIEIIRKAFAIQGKAR